jgi:hypothetical protein
MSAYGSAVMIAQAEDRRHTVCARSFIHVGNTHDHVADNARRLRGDWCTELRWMKHVHAHSHAHKPAAHKVGRASSCINVLWRFECVGSGLC